MATPLYFPVVFPCFPMFQDFLNRFSYVFPYAHWISAILRWISPGILPAPTTLRGNRGALGRTLEPLTTRHEVLQGDLAGWYFWQKIMDDDWGPNRETPMTPRCSSLKKISIGILDILWWYMSILRGGRGYLEPLEPQPFRVSLIHQIISFIIVYYFPPEVRSWFQER